MCILQHVHFATRALCNSCNLQHMQFVPTARAKVVSVRLTFLGQRKEVSCIKLITFVSAMESTNMKTESTRRKFGLFFQSGSTWCQTYLLIWYIIIEFILSNMASLVKKYFGLVDGFRRNYIAKSFFNIKLWLFFDTFPSYCIVYFQSLQ